MTIRYHEAPDYYTPADGDPPAVFLAGGITGCPRWHDHALRYLRESKVSAVVCNPHRVNFPIHDPRAGWDQFRWEQHHLHLPGMLTMMWFPAPVEPHVVQPIAMFELGQALGEGRQLLVGADPGYPRERDVHYMICWNRPDMTVHTSLDELLEAVVIRLSGGVGRG